MFDVCGFKKTIVGVQTMEYRVEKVIVMSFNGAYYRLTLSLDGRGVVYVFLVGYTNGGIAT